MPTPTPSLEIETTINTTGEAAIADGFQEVGLVDGAVAAAAISTGTATPFEPLALGPKETVHKHHHRGIGATGYISIAVLAVFLIYILKKVRDCMTNINLRQNKDDHFNSLL